MRPYSVGILAFSALGLVGLMLLTACPSASSSSGSSNTSTGNVENGGGSSGWTVITSSGATIVNPTYGDKSNRSSAGANSGISGEFDVYFFDSNNGWFVGNRGDLIKFTNGTPPVEFLNINDESGTLRSVILPSASQVFVSGDDSTLGGDSIYYSSNGGTTWSTVANTVSLFPGRSLNTLDRINALAAVVNGSTTTYWAAGGLGDNTAIILKSNNGTTWTSIYRESTPSMIQSIDFYDANNGVAVGANGTILVTATGGDTWVVATSGTESTLYEVRMMSESSAIVVGANGVALRTLDGGSTFSALSTGTQNDLYALAVRGTKVWAGGESGTIIYSANSGTSWTAQTSNTNYDLQALYFLSDTVGFAVGGTPTSTSTGVILTTLTGGQ
jgi:photosystem II stability/assembly factor-like uncharacterized protein